jgi:iron-sulfur cluster repair protein YtfE (RIC family)
VKWFGRLFLNHFRQQIPQEVDKNLRRYISELVYKIIKTIDSVHKQTLHYISSEIKTVENILQHEDDNSAELQKNIDRLKGLLMNLNEIGFSQEI